jgi:LacI family transcriptional regulator
MTCLLEAKISIPKQIAVIGCGNLHYDEFLRVPLSSVDQKSAVIGERAAQIILNHVILKKDEEPLLASSEMERVVLRPKLIVRESSSR